MRKFTIWDVIITVTMLAVICASLVPAVARLQRTPEDATCQANMRRWGEAIRLYTADWDGFYPTNRTKPQGVMNSSVLLSPRQFDANGNPIRFVKSINWVEAMFPYIINDSSKTGRDWESFMKCPNASPTPWANSQTARMTYVLNYNLLEQPSGIMKNAAKTMMMREMDRLVDSVCKPYNKSSSSNKPPQSPFLISVDYGMRGVTFNCKLHGQGSYILFADGHVKYFSSEFFPTNLVLSMYDNWDNDTQQWWNWVNKTPELNKAIAVTP